MGHTVFVVLHGSLVSPSSAITETRKWSASLTASQEMVMSFDEQLTSALTFWGGQGAVNKEAL